MAESFNQAWILLGVGMITVFTVLLLVVLIGNAVIAFVNRYFPEPPQLSGAKPDKKSEASKMAAIVAAVKRVTGGKGNVVEIHRK
ncbi:MAG: OadG family transporter subunit [Marinilabilia sp.]